MWRRILSGNLPLGLGGCLLLGETEKEGIVSGGLAACRGGRDLGGEEKVDGGLLEVGAGEEGAAIEQRSGGGPAGNEIDEAGRGGGHEAVCETGAGERSVGEDASHPFGDGKVPGGVEDEETVDLEALLLESCDRGGGLGFGRRGNAEGASDEVAGPWKVT